MNSTETKPLLGVNIDHIATLRQARGTRYPDPVQGAITAEMAGANGITLHLREDRRHIQERDVEILKDTLQTKMNLEMAATDEMIKLAVRYQPEDCCLVPERRKELTTEGGLDVASNIASLRETTQTLTDAGIQVSLFIDADKRQINAARKVDAPFIEIHTGHFADAKKPEQKQQELEKIQEAVAYAQEIGLKVNAGHGLHYSNTAPIAKIPGIYELNIGHAIIAQALFEGMSPAVKKMLTIIRQA
jgi:pyridoxine 5-phosphate synthase